MEEQKNNGFLVYIGKLAVTVLGVALAVWILFGAVFEIEVVAGDSMAPSLEDGDFALSYRLAEEFSYGDVVVVSGLSDADYIKRIIGLPGDTIDIDMQSGRVLRNGEILDEPYANGLTLIKGSGTEFPLTLAEDEYFLLGDNRMISYDGRIWGAVRKDYLKAKVLWPDLSYRENS